MQVGSVEEESSTWQEEPSWYDSTDGTIQSIIWTNGILRDIMSLQNTTTTGTPRGNNINAIHSRVIGMDNIHQVLRLHHLHRDSLGH